MKTPLITTLSIAGVLLAAGSAYAVNASVLSAPSLEQIGSSETAAVIVPHVKTLPGEEQPASSEPAESADAPGATASPDPSVLPSAASVEVEVEDEDEQEDEIEGADDSDDAEEAEEQESEDYGDDDD